MYRKLLPWYIDQEEHLVSVKSVENCLFEKEKITLLNWNVHKNNHSYNWLQDFKYILHHYSPDLISFQEYERINKNSIIEQHSEYGYGFFPNIERSAKEYGLLSASKCEIESYNHLFSQHLEPLIKTPKVSFLTRYKFQNDKKLTMINVHMINFVKKNKYFAQLKQLEFLCSGENMLILTGDFNTWNLKRMHALKILTKELRLEHVEFKIDSHKKKYLSYPLDHIFYKGFEVSSSKILQNIQTSDHKPIIVNFSNKL